MKGIPWERLESPNSKTTSMRGLFVHVVGRQFQRDHYRLREQKGLGV